MIIANNPDIEINIKLSPEDYCRRYPSDYACRPGRSGRVSSDKKDCCKDEKNVYNINRLVFTNK